MNLDEVVTEVAERLAASVVLVDRAFSLIAYSTQSPASTKIGCSRSLPAVARRRRVRGTKVSGLPIPRAQ